MKGSLLFSNNQRRQQNFHGGSIHHMLKLFRQILMVPLTGILVISFSELALCQSAVSQPNKISEAFDCGQFLSKSKVERMVLMPNGRHNSKLIWIYCDNTIVTEENTEMETDVDFAARLRKILTGGREVSNRSVHGLLGTSETKEFLLERNRGKTTIWIVVLRADDRTLMFESSSLVHVLYMRESLKQCKSSEPRDR